LSDLVDVLTEPERPDFGSSARRTIGRTYDLLGGGFGALAAMAATAALTAVSLTVRNATIEAILRTAVLVVAGLLSFVVLLLFWSYALAWTDYVETLSQRHGMIRRSILAAAGMSAQSELKEYPSEIVGIRSREGEVNLLLPKSSGLLLDSLLDVVTVTGEVWGTVRVAELTDSEVWAIPDDRINPQFWQSLDDRAGRDPSAPRGVRIEPYLPIEVRSLLRTQREDELS